MSPSLLSIRNLLALVFGLAVALLFAACNPEVLERNEHEWVAAEPAGDPIRLGFSASAGWIPWQVAEEQGLFEDNGVEVELTYFDDYADSLNALETGSLDANSQTLTDTIASVADGSEQTIVLTNGNATGNEQLIAREGVDSVVDLRGRTVAAEQGTVGHYLLLLALEEAGLAPDDVEFRPLATDAAAAAFVAGRVDAVGVSAPFTTTALERAGSQVIASSADFPGAIPDHLAVASGLAEDRPEDVQALVATWFETLAWIEAHPEEAAEIMADRAGGSAQDYRAYDDGSTVFTLEQNLQAFAEGDSSKHLGWQAERTATFLTEAGLIDQVPNLDGLLDARFLHGVAR